ncbi:tropomyosin [Plakobranchus ocellatus]|uniref:Tropomyosin n=1 Tax=Plakobranchus ocellatus TaxID=259542 RepID=A0AAV4DCP8_9GAST|nr:tropomyosin [Plakobranchus ocellatus]
MGDRELLEFDESDGTHLSQDSQLSAVSNSLSQDLSQGSNDATPANTLSSTEKSEKKKKKKHKSDRTSKSKDKNKDKNSRDRNEPHDCDSATEGSKDKSSRRSSKSKSDKSKKEKKTKRASSGRPEPEGGNSSQPDSLSALEYDRIINNSDPLFSDLEMDLDDEESKRPQRPRRTPRQGRGAPAGGIFIPCTQLGINSNTMIKFAIIGTELQNIFKVSQRVRIVVVELFQL